MYKRCTIICEDIKEEFVNVYNGVVKNITVTTKFDNWDMVEFDNNGIIKNLVIKQNRPDIKFGWTIAMWSPVFTEFMHDFLNKIEKELVNGLININGKLRELYLGDVIQAAIKQKLKIENVIFPEGKCLDIGTPEDQDKALEED